MNKIYCLNAIAKVGTEVFGDRYALTENIDEATGIMVRSAAMQCQWCKGASSLWNVACSKRYCGWHRVDSIH